MQLPNLTPILFLLTTLPHLHLTHAQLVAEIGDGQIQAPTGAPTIPPTMEPAAAEMPASEMPASEMPAPAAPEETEMPKVAATTMPSMMGTHMAMATGMGTGMLVASGMSGAMATGTAMGSGTGMMGAANATAPTVPATAPIQEGGSSQGAEGAGTSAGEEGVATANEAGRLGWEGMGMGIGIGMVAAMAVTGAILM